MCVIIIMMVFVFNFSCACDRFPKMFLYLVNHPKQDRYDKNELFLDNERYLYRTLHVFLLASYICV